MKQCVLACFVVQMRHSSAVRKSFQDKLSSFNLKAGRATRDTRRFCLDFTLNITARIWYSENPDES